MVLFGVHLGLLGYLVYRSGYIPRPFGIGLTIAGLGYHVYYLQPYLYPDLDLPFSSSPSPAWENWPSSDGYW